MNPWDRLQKELPGKHQTQTSMNNKNINFLGWILFLVSAIGFIISSVGNFWAMFGSIFFLVACVVFMVPYLRKSNQDPKQDESQNE